MKTKRLYSLILMALYGCSAPPITIVDGIIADSAVVWCDKRVMNDTNMKCWDCEPSAELYLRSRDEVMNAEIISLQAKVKVNSVLDTVSKNRFKLTIKGINDYRTGCIDLFIFLNTDLQMVLHDDTIEVKKSPVFKVKYRDTNIPPPF